MDGQRSRQWQRDAAVVVALAAAYFLAAKLGLALAVGAQQVSAVWPPTGIALAAVLRFGARVWPGVFAGALAANATADEPLWVAAGIAAGNTLEALLAARIVVLTAKQGDAVRGAFGFLLAAALAPAVSASIGVTSLVAGGVQPAAGFVENLRVWWIGDALGALVLAPVFATWPRPLVPAARRRLELAALVAAAAVVGAAAFYHSSKLPFTEYIVFPFVIWAAMRLSIPSTAAVLMACDAVAIAATYAGYGPFAGLGPERGLVHLQAFVAVAAATGLLLAAIAHENRSAESAARARAQELEAIMDAVPVAVWMANDPSCASITGNRYGHELLRMAAGANLSKTAANEGERPRHFSVHRGGVELRPDELPMQRAARENRELLDWEEELVFSDGSRRYLYGNAIPLRAPDGSARGAVAAFVDLTRQRQTEEALRDADHRKNLFLAMLAHELRNPLAAIGTAAAVLEREPGRIDTVQIASQIISRQTTHLTRLLDDLLDVARVVSGKIHLTRETIDLGAVAQAAVDSFCATAGEARPRIRVARASVHVNADRTRIEQVVINLLANALAHTPVNGEMVVDVHAVEGEALLTVSDTGAGLTQDECEHAFDLFYQGAQDARHKGGLGIGLTLVRHIAELHGGTVSVSSSGPGTGAQFVVRLPLVAAPGAAVHRDPALPPACASRRILVIEDNDDARTSLALALRLDGHSVQEAATGAAGLERACELEAEIVFVDIGLPDMDGYQVARMLRARGCEGALIALTGYGQQDDVRRAHEAGFDVHLTKPADAEQLRTAIAAVEPRRDAAVAGAAT